MQPGRVQVWLWGLPHLPPLGAPGRTNFTKAWFFSWLQIFFVCSDISVAMLKLLWLFPHATLNAVFLLLLKRCCRNITIRARKKFYSHEKIKAFCEIRPSWQHEEVQIRKFDSEEGRFPSEASVTLEIPHEGSWWSPCHFKGAAGGGRVLLCQYREMGHPDAKAFKHWLFDVVGLLQYSVLQKKIRS